MSSFEHDLREFIRQDLTELKDEYQRIRRRATEDSGTAGDESEAGWAALLEEWLPDSYTIVKGGRILSLSGEASPQIDVLVLAPGYPTRLKSKKLYLSAGVLAAFECKLTLDRRNLTSAIQRCKDFREMFPRYADTPRDALLGPFFYGVLAHDHSWAEHTAQEHVEEILEEHINRSHPIYIPDVVCVGSLATWRKLAAIDAETLSDPLSPTTVGGTMMQVRAETQEGEDRDDAPLAGLLASLLKHLAQRDETLRPLASYFGIATNSRGGSARRGADYPRSVLPHHVIQGMLDRIIDHSGGYPEFDEWSTVHSR